MSGQDLEKAVWSLAKEAYWALRILRVREAASSSATGSAAVSGTAPPEATAKKKDKKGGPAGRVPNFYWYPIISFLFSAHLL